MMTKKEDVQQITIKFSGSEIIEREVSKFGTGAHLIVPKEYAGRTVKIIFENSANGVKK
jgi:putative transposon-encoded protein